MRRHFNHTLNSDTLLNDSEGQDSWAHRLEVQGHFAADLLSARYPLFYLMGNCW
jgi:hypothetical protein